MQSTKKTTKYKILANFTLIINIKSTGARNKKTKRAVIDYSYWFWTKSVIEPNDVRSHILFPHQTNVKMCIFDIVETLSMSYDVDEFAVYTSIFVGRLMPFFSFLYMFVNHLLFFFQVILRNSNEFTRRPNTHLYIFILYYL